MPRKICKNMFLNIPTGKNVRILLNNFFIHFLNLISTGGKESQYGDNT